MEFDFKQSSMELVNPTVCNSSDSFSDKNEVEEESPIVHLVCESSELFSDKEVVESLQSYSDKEIIEEALIAPTVSESSESFYDDAVLVNESDYNDEAETWMRESQQLQDTSKEEVRPSVDVFEDEEEVRPSLVAYPFFRDNMQANLSNMECGVPTQLSFFVREIADKTFFKAIEDYDPHSKRLLYQLDRLYHNYPVDTLGEITFEKHLLYIW
ncbi:putative lecithin:cholesterol/phospholipid:diacylglycerol acyltransferase [Helianthus annuus]|nr:putative lecithin:cholesterol/phospholipid:diacylglycerol acyltransferase [Helianthus annuus]